MTDPKSKAALLFKAMDVWRDRDLLIDLREDWGNEHGMDDKYEAMQRDIEIMAERAISFERGVDPDEVLVFGSDAWFDSIEPIPF